MYLPYGTNQGGFPDMTLVVRGSLPPAQLVPALRSAIRQVDAHVPTQRIRLMDEVIDDSLAGRRLGLFLVTSFAALALLLAASGLYGVISFLVAQRTPEIGVRMALGADRGTILRLMLGRSAVLALSGIAIGLLGAFWLSRLLARMLYGVGTHDAVTFIGAPLLLAVTALFAALIPSLRAARTDPIVALRAE
jgi:ABC-type antimicrobial peptide transport system permease subunit